MPNPHDERIIAQPAEDRGRQFHSSYSEAAPHEKSTLRGQILCGLSPTCAPHHNRLRSIPAAPAGISPAQPAVSFNLAFLNGFTAMANYSKYQQKVIKNYYDNQEAILLQRLGEHVTELYLADGKARAKRWKDITKVLEKLKVPQSRIDTLLSKDNPSQLAKLLEELLAKQK